MSIESICSLLALYSRFALIRHSWKNFQFPTVNCTVLSSIKWSIKSICLLLALYSLFAHNRHSSNDSEFPKVNCTVLSSSQLSIESMYSLLALYSLLAPKRHSSSHSQFPTVSCTVLSSIKLSIKSICLLLALYSRFALKRHSSSNNSQFPKVRGGMKDIPPLTIRNSQGIGGMSFIPPLIFGNCELLEEECPKSLWEYATEKCLKSQLCSVSTTPSLPAIRFHKAFLQQFSILQSPGTYD